VCEKDDVGVREESVVRVGDEMSPSASWLYLENPLNSGEEARSNASELSAVCGNDARTFVTNTPVSGTRRLEARWSKLGWDLYQGTWGGGICKDDKDTHEEPEKSKGLSDSPKISFVRV
jgi:hypothetical protein